MADIPENSAPGYVGRLDASQQEKLHQFWRILMQSWDSTIPGPDPARKLSVSSSGTTKPHRRFFSLGRAQTQPTEEETTAVPPNLLSTLKSLGAGPDEIKTINTLCQRLPGDKLRAALISALKQDHPDALCLRFIRAEKWNIPKAWIKLVSALNWRVNEYKVDEEVLLKGEGYHLEKSRQSGDSIEKKDGQGFVHQLKTGKGHYHGADKWGRPICIVRVRTHNPSDQTLKGLNDYIIHCIETVRYLQVPPVETMAIVFDLTSFSLSNWDFPPVKFIIDSFQENYPESLGALIFYNAPWIFSGFWKIIHGILDPVVAAKVHFISGAKELEKMVPRSQIIKELGGEENWEYEYVEPSPKENDRLKDSTTREGILVERKKLGDDLFTLTTEWISTFKSDPSPTSRDDVIRKLRENYWQLDPYVRVRSVLDRTGVINESGRIDFYPMKVSPEVNEKSKILPEHLDNAQIPAVAA
ncbi:uncharacterized protein N7443_005628 [Penicillium atrosanguineum]|uniref:uncharacterized protein n=1 Tax=Penicillium atrosanguineum TaxID=1132637 RepID=UPI00239950CF|nr:uncharacterized protein N7443_005628 [Penicillium atrosanguineum]KAJ5300626.1 hypothetical protein N7443_005628 [Penicillium atrosanguineum]